MITNRLIYRKGYIWVNVCRLAETGGSLWACSTELVSSQSGLHRETQSWKTNKQTKRYIELSSDQLSKIYMKYN